MRRDKYTGREKSRGRKEDYYAENGSRGRKYKPWRSEDGEFRCSNCRQMVLVTDMMATAHRNHCPWCLWSLHVDTKPGNRASDCRARMEPVGLTFKRAGFDKYGRPRAGDVMLVHFCRGCGEININRIAGDDSLDRVWELFANQQSMAAALRAAIAGNGIGLLRPEDAEALRTSLSGKG